MLRGLFIDVFKLLRPETDPGRTGTRRNKSRVAKGGAEHTFHNWLAGYSVYVTLVSAAFLERVWHLMYHLSNVVKARAPARDGPAIDYDEAFRQRASHNELAWWDLCNNNLWLELVASGAPCEGTGGS